MSLQHDKFFNELKDAVEEDRLLLPSLPEVALEIRAIVECENTTTEQIAEVLSQDSSLSARLLKVVNSPLYRTRNPVDDLHMAVTRMGTQKVRDLVINLAMKQMFQPTSEVMEKQFRSAWNTSVEVAAISQMMSASIDGIRKEQALLAGLIHNIGSLPILLLAENDDDLFNDSVALNSLIWELQGPVGAMILQSWNFSDDLVEVVSQCHNFAYDQNDGASLVDVVQVALLHGGFLADEHSPDSWSSVPAFSKLGMDAEVNVVQVEENQEMIDSARQSLLA
jgi:HD-like signal output (HDOD) protein